MANAHAEHHDPNVYYVPHGSRWPVFASVALFTTMIGFASWLNEVSWGRTVFLMSGGSPTDGFMRVSSNSRQA